MVKSFLYEPLDPKKIMGGENYTPANPLKSALLYAKKNK